MAALPASGGVRSLLAKFENTNNNSNNNNGNNNSGVTIDGSPSRGRLSGDSQDSATNRPLSKVRASFVSVERTGQSSPTPGILRRVESYSTDVDSSQRSTTVSPTGQLEAASASPFGSSPHRIRTALAAFQNDRVESVTAKLASLAIKDKVQPSSPPEKPDTALKTTATGLQQSAVIEESAKISTTPSSTKQAAPPKTMKKSTSTVSMMKDSSNNKNTKTATTKPKDAPATTKTPTRSTITTTRPAVHAEKSVNNKPVTARNTTSTARAERASTPHKDGVARAAVEPSPRSKPVSKSPTRPARLPPSLVTPTAASSAKTGTLARSQSHVNLRSSPKVENVKTLTRKLSTLKPDSARPSPNSAADRPRSRMSTASSRAPQEDSFLARMMRPTASSASKIHDKIEPRSPPRLAKPANLTQKKTTPTKHVAEKKVPQIEPTHTPSDSKAAAAQEVASATTHNEIAPENAKIMESQVISSLEKPAKAEPSSPPATVTESVSKATSEPSPEPSTVEPEAPVIPVELSTEPLAENPVEEQLSDVAEKESGNTSTAIGEGLPSVPETDVHEPDNVVEKAEEKPVEFVPAKTVEEAKIDVSQAESTPETSAKVPALDGDAFELVDNAQEATQQPEPTNDSASAPLQDKTSDNEVQEETEKITLPEETTDAVAGKSEATVEHAEAEGDV